MTRPDRSHVQYFTAILQHVIPRIPLFFADKLIKNSSTMLSHVPFTKTNSMLTAQFDPYSAPPIEIQYTLVPLLPELFYIT